jgi:pyruvate/2-oxoglutarate dehydrogenase complex dihydrolipoamide acyltransferase (E2) component
MRVPIRLPDLGDQAVVLSFWFARPGDELFEGERVVEVLSDGITFDVAAPATGQLADQFVFNDDPLTAGQALGTIEVRETTV